MSGKQKPQRSEEIPNLPTQIKGEILSPAPDPYTVAKLTIVKGNDEGSEFMIQKGVTGIGRASDNEIALTDLSCSRKHVQLIWEDDSLVISDLGSGNGTVLNKHRVTRTELRNKDVFEIGNTQFKVELFAPFEEAQIPRIALKAPEPVQKKPPSPVAQVRTVALPGLRDNPDVQALIGGALPPISFEEPKPVPVTPTPKVGQSGVLSRLSSIGQERGKTWIYALAGGNALALFTGAALLLWNPSASANASLNRFQEGVAAYSKMDWGAAETAFKESLSLTPSLSEAADYLRMTQNEQANASRLSAAENLLSSGVADAKTSVVALSLALSVPIESVSGGKAKKLAHEAKKALSTSARTSVEIKIEQNNPRSFQAAAFELKQAEIAFGGQLPANLTDLAARLQAASMKSDWHELTTQPLTAMADPMPAVSPMPVDPTPTVVAPAVTKDNSKDEAAKAMKAEALKAEAAKEEAAKLAAKEAKEEAKAAAAAMKEEAAKAEAAKLAAAKVEANKTAVVTPPPTDPKTTTPNTTAANTTAKAEPTKLDEKTAKANAQALYREGKFEKAALEAKKNKKTEQLAKNIEEFATKYASVKSKYASGERATIYDNAKRAASLDNLIDGAYQADLKTWVGQCADAKARQLYNTANSTKPTNYSLFKEAYVVAQEANRNGGKKESGPIIKAIDDDVAKKMAAGKAAENKGKINDAINFYDIVTQYIPAGSQTYNEASKAAERLRSSQGGL
jgi:pSer/pThr/pTyr-binding forkhead associated (FHA) protein